MLLPEQSQEVPDIPPFWQRLPQFFLYPFRLGPLLYISLLSCATLLFVHILPLAFAIVMLFGVALIFMRYACKVLDHTAMGLLTPEQQEMSDDTGHTSLLFKLVGVFFIIGFVTGLAGSMGGVVGGLLLGAVMIYGTLSIPAVMMVLFVTRSFWAALNPFQALRMMAVVGWPYLGLSVFIILLEASEMVVLDLLEAVPLWLTPPAAAFVFMYFSLIMFNMVGYVIYQHHHALGVEIRRDDSIWADGDTDDKAAAGNKKADSYAALIASGQINKALDMACEETRLDPENIAVNDRYHKLLLLSYSRLEQQTRERLQESERRGDPDSARQYLGQDLSRFTERLFSHSRSCIALLLKRNFDAEAIELFRATRKNAPEFDSREPAQVLRLAQAARQARDPSLTLSLLKGFDKRFPRSDEIPSVYFLAAQTLSEHYRDDAKARKILTHLLGRYSAHPVSDSARSLLTTLEKMA